MSKRHISVHKDIKVAELDTDKQYAIIFPDYTTPEDFEHARQAILKMGVDKFIAIHKASDTKFMRLEEIDDTEN
jgi:hypothetical protein